MIETTRIIYLEDSFFLFDSLVRFPGYRLPFVFFFIFGDAFLLRR